MKVVLFCGGFGVRMGEATQRIPKPMIPVGGRPILWHIMKYYAAWGHTDFILCLGYKAEVIKQYFLDYNEALSNDFVLSGGGRDITLLRTDMDSWTITFVDTGTRATIGDRLKSVASFLEDDPVFLATYGDGLTDAPLDRMLEHFHERKKTAMFLTVPPRFNAHLVESDADGVVTRVEELTRTGISINGGYFVLRREIMEYLEAGEELVEEPFRRLIEADQLIVYPHDGFWAPMDTLKDKQYLDGLAESGQRPWANAPAVAGDAAAQADLV
jgi:glucose-1-phosphate cytidylyltransferase